MKTVLIILTTLTAIFMSFPILHIIGKTYEGGEQLLLPVFAFIIFGIPATIFSINAIIRNDPRVIRIAKICLSVIWVPVALYVLCIGILSIVFN